MGVNYGACVPFKNRVKFLSNPCVFAPAAHKYQNTHKHSFSFIHSANKNTGVANMFTLLFLAATRPV